MAFSSVEESLQLWNGDGFIKIALMRFTPYSIHHMWRKKNGGKLNNNCPCSERSFLHEEKKTCIRKVEDKNASYPD